VDEAPSSNNFFRETGIATFSGAIGGAAGEIFAIWEAPDQVICNCYAQPSAHKSLGRTASEIAAATGDAGGVDLILAFGNIGLAVVIGGVAGMALGGLALFVYRKWWKPGNRGGKTSKARA